MLMDKLKFFHASYLSTNKIINNGLVLINHKIYLLWSGGGTIIILSNHVNLNVNLNAAFVIQRYNKLIDNSTSLYL